MSILRSVSKCLKKFTQPTVSQHFCTNAKAEKIAVENMSISQNKNSIVWIDMEMSGFDVENDCVLEVACLITDENLNIISKEFHMVLNQPDSVLAGMNDWCKTHHSKSGLIETSKNSTENESSVDKSLLFFMMEHIPKGKCPMAGNSVYLDRLFLRKYFPVANEYMHYRIIDVSSIKEVVKRWKPEIHSILPQKEFNHRALDDIKESIKELDFYRKNIFNVSGS